MAVAAIKWFTKETASSPEAASREDLIKTIEGLTAAAETRGFSPWKQSLFSKDGDLTSYNMFPIKDMEAYEFYKKQQSTLWVADEIDFSVDAAEYIKLKPRYQQIYRDFLGFFAPGDGLITEAATRFLAEARTYPEAAFLTAQNYCESIHAETYGLAIMNVIPSEAEQNEVFNAVNDLECVKSKAEFIKRYMNDPNLPLGTRYLAGAFGEGVFFAALFALVFFFKSKNVFKSFNTANTFIMRDETLHRGFNCAMAKRYAGYTQEEAHAMAQHAYDVEIGHLTYILREPIDSAEADASAGLTIEAVSSYVRTLTDQVLVLAGVEALFNEGDEAAELPWMNCLGLTPKGNFYETLITAYSQISVKQALANNSNVNNNTEKHCSEIDF